ncbi:MAG TPA: Flp pilus assembly protein CpaB [Terriglobales bacterium]|nr:Flp pilus assembly protein CpaB [Terriglobales bacterium]
MSQRVFTILLIALIVSAGASYVVYRLVRTRISSASAPVTSEIVVAARKLDIGVLLKAEDLKTGQWPGPLPQGMLVKKEDAVGRGVVAAIYEGEPINDSRLAPAGAGAGLAASIPPGMRAVALRVNDVVGVAGFVVPGMRVDVLISATPPGASAGSNPETRTPLKLQNIEILSAATNIQKDPEGKPMPVSVVNVLVTPEQAEILSVASNETRIQLILRNPLDNEQTKPPAIKVADLFEGAKAPAAPAPHKRAETKTIAAVMPPKPAAPLPPYQIEVLNGPRRSELKFNRKPEEPQQ